MKQSTSIRWLIQRIHKRIPALLLMSGVHVLQALFGVWFVLGTRTVIDCAVSGEQELFAEACLKQFLIILCVLVCLTLFRHLKEKLNAELDRDWKQQLLHGLLHGEYMSVSDYHSAELMNRMNNDVRVVDEGLLTILPSVSGLLTRLFAAVAVLVTLDPVFTFVIACLGCLMIVITGLLRGHLKELHKRVSEQDGRVSGLLQETMEKLLLVQAMDVSDEVERRTALVLDERYQMQRRRKNVSLLANTGVSVMSYGAGFLALAWCAFRLLQGTMSFGTLTAVTQLVSQLQSPFVGLSGVYPKYVAMIASAERLMELESIPSEPDADSLDLDVLYHEMSDLAGQGLCFSYGRTSSSDDQMILCGASFKLSKGSFAVVTGSSGIGKSTLLKLLLGIYPLHSGELYLQTKQSRVKLDRSTRKLFAYVPQGNLLFSGSIKENLTIVKPDASKEELDLAVYVSAMDEFLPELSHGLDTVIGENGAGLSEGQAQRLAIARAVLGGAKILLLDECTSALDQETEKLVLQRLKSLQDRTCIAVTHRPAAMELCDCQLQVSNGLIVQSNGHDSLM